MNITEEELKNLYCVEMKSCREIGIILNKTASSVHHYLKKAGIKARPWSTKGVTAWNKGVPMREESKSKLRKAHIGKKIPLEIRLKMGSKGSKNAGYIDGRTPKNKLIRHSIEYKLWIQAVFERDNWTCQECKTRGGEIHAHHIKHFAKYPEFRTSIENGITLCKTCHRKIHRAIN